MKPAGETMAALGTTVFEVMSRLAIEHGAINPGQGFPDEDGPADVRQVAADHANRFHGLDDDWQSEVIVTSGATSVLIRLHGAQGPSAPAESGLCGGLCDRLG